MLAFGKKARYLYFNIIAVICPVYFKEIRDFLIIISLERKPLNCSDKNGIIIIYRLRQSHTRKEIL